MNAKLVASVLLVGAVTIVSAAESTRWAERAKVDVRTGRGSYFDVVDTLLKGESVELLKTEERWLLVKTPRAKQGWVFEAALAAKPVAAGTSDFLKLAPGDASTSTTAASQGAKGLYAQDYARQKGYDYGVVQWVEEHQPSGGEMEAFAQESAPGGGAR